MNLKKILKAVAKVAVTVLPFLKKEAEEGKIRGTGGDILKKL